jgi:tellurite resistance protein TehA-like permease
VPVGVAMGRAAGPALRKEHLMLDIIMIAIGLGFFALSVGYTIACDRL